MHVEEHVQITVPLTPFRFVDAVGASHRIEPGCVGLINPGEPCGAIAHDGRPLRARTILVDVEALNRLRRDLQGALPHCPTWFPRRVVFDRSLAAELNTVWNELHHPARGSGSEARLRGCLVRLVRDHHHAPSPAFQSQRCSAALHRVRDYLRAHVSTRVSLERLAAVAGLSKCHLQRAFVRAYGLSPHQYQTELRLARARTLLAHGVPPSFAALDSGFADQSHLTRRMKAACGCTPAAYARRFRAFARSTSGHPADTPLPDLSHAV